MVAQLQQVAAAGKRRVQQPVGRARLDYEIEAGVTEHSLSVR